MSTVTAWPVWAKFLVGALILYSALLFAVSVVMGVTAWRNSWALKPQDIAMQALMAIFLPLLLVGLRRQRLASGLLFLVTGVELLLLLTMNRSTGDGTSAMLLGSIAFLGIPILGAAIFMHHLAQKRN